MLGNDKPDVPCKNFILKLAWEIFIAELASWDGKISFQFIFANFALKKGWMFEALNCYISPELQKQKQSHQTDLQIVLV